MDSIKDLGAHGLVALLVIAIATLFVLLGKMTADSWVAMAQWVVGIFTGGHAAMTIGESVTSKGKPTSTEPTK